MVLRDFTRATAVLNLKANGFKANSTAKAQNIMTTAWKKNSKERSSLENPNKGYGMTAMAQLFILVTRAGLPNSCKNSIGTIAVPTSSRNGVTQNKSGGTAKRALEPILILAYAKLAQEIVTNITN